MLQLYAMAKPVIRGGKNLAAYLKKAKNAKSIKKIEVGFFEDAKYPDGTQVAAVAAWNEFGTERNGQQHVPERPFMRNAIAGSENDLLDVLHENVDPENMVVDERTAGKLGLTLSDAISRSIETLRDPPNAPSTIARKKKDKSANPLVDTGVMKNSVNFKVS